MSQKSWSDLHPTDREDLVRLEQDYSLIPTLPSDDKQAVVDFVRTRLGPSDFRNTEVTASSEELSAIDAALSSKRPFWSLTSLAVGIPSDLEVSEQFQELVERLSFPLRARSVREGLKTLGSHHDSTETDDIISMLTFGMLRTVRFVTYRHILSSDEDEDIPSWDVAGSYLMSSQPGKGCHSCRNAVGPYHTHTVYIGHVESDKAKATLKRLATASRARTPARIKLDPIEPTKA